MPTSPMGHSLATTFGVTKLRAKKPNTTVGMPARISSTGLMTRRTPGRAYSLR